MNSNLSLSRLTGLLSFWLVGTALAQPFAFTQAAGPVTTTNAMLNGMVTPRGLTTAAWFEWGTDDSYGQVTSSVDAGNGTNVVRLSAAVEGLIPDSTYRCRLVASNSAGITYGLERRFTTGRRVVSWGETIWGPLGSVLPPSNLGNVVSMAAGDYHGLALKADGTIVAWGRYLSGSIASVPPGLSNIIVIAGGSGHSLALKSDGEVVAWGDNASGQTNVPASLSNVVAVSAGDAHSLALRSNGTLAAWGQFNFGSPVFIPAGLSNVVAISSGDRHCLALRNNGTVVAWGDNTFGQSSVPLGLSNVVAIAAGYQHGLALKTNGSLVAWGSNSRGQTTIPSGLTNIVAITAGDYHNLVLRSDGTVAIWGTSLGFVGTNPPVGLDGTMAIACGDEFCLALASNTPPQAVIRTLTGPVNQDSILSLTTLVRDPNGDLLTYRVLSPPASGFLYQILSGGRGTAITETNTPVNDPSGRVIFVPGLDEFGAPYTSFTVVASDGEFDSAPSVATVNVVPSPAVTVVGPSQNSNGVALSFTGLSNAAYSVLTSVNLTNWSRLGSASQPSPGQFFYYDTSITNQPRRFFRIRSP